MNNLVDQDQTATTRTAVPEALQSRLSVVIPAYNEASGIGGVLTTLREQLPGAEIIVVDDASEDSTSEIITTFKDIVKITHPFNCGYGASLKTGMRNATRSYIAWFDADNEHRAEDLVGMLSRIGDAKLAAIIGERANPAASRLRHYGKLTIRILSRILGAKSVKDINCGLRIFHRDAIIRYLSVLPNGYSASTTSTLIMLERGYPIEFFQISLNSRKGISKVSIGDGFTVLFMVLRIILLIAPLRIFLSSGLMAIALGASYGLVRMLQVGGSFPVSAFVVMTVGMSLCVLGLITDQLSQLRLGAIDDRKMSE